jgi:hypothetical protein
MSVSGKGIDNCRNVSDLHNPKALIGTAATFRAEVAGHTHNAVCMNNAVVFLLLHRGDKMRCNV